MFLLPPSPPVSQLSLLQAGKDTCEEDKSAAASTVPSTLTDDHDGVNSAATANTNSSGSTPPVSHNTVTDYTSGSKETGSRTSEDDARCGSDSNHKVRSGVM
jgi:hypothetical protein